MRVQLGHAGSNDCLEVVSRGLSQSDVGMGMIRTRAREQSQGSTWNAADSIYRLEWMW